MMLETDLEYMYLRRRIEFLDAIRAVINDHDMTIYDSSIDQSLKNLEAEYDDVSDLSRLLASLESVKKDGQR